eukprot:9711266-Prorocentrum_lima.AAC.1
MTPGEEAKWESTYRPGEQLPISTSATRLECLLRVALIDCISKGHLKKAHARWMSNINRHPYKDRE